MHIKKLKLEEIREGIEDIRWENSVQYPLYEVLFIMIIAIMCGATSKENIPNKQFHCLFDSDCLDRIVGLWLCS